MPGSKPGLARWARIAFGAVGLFAAIAAVASGAEASPVGPSYSVWHKIFLLHLKRQSILVSTSASSTHDVWAIGNAGAAADLSFAVHWNGRLWSVKHFPNSTFFAETVRESGPTNVWVAGDDRRNGEYMAYRWDGLRWHAMTMPQDSAGMPPVVLSRSDVWVSGYSNWTQGAGWSSSIFHWDGQAWTHYSLPVFADEHLYLGGSSNRQLWAAGVRTSANSQTTVGRLAVYHWNGHRWRQAPLAPKLVMVSSPELAVSNSGEVWVVGHGRRVAHGDHVPIVLYRRDGRWHRLGTQGFGAAEPYPDGLTGVWLEAPEVYWNGSSFPLVHFTDRCAGFNSTGIDDSYGIPRTHIELFAASCLDRRTGKQNAMLMATGPFRPGA